MADLLDGAEPFTARSRQLALLRFSAWLAEEDEIDRVDLVGLKAPKPDQKVIQPLADEQIRALIAARGKLSPTGNTFWDRRDKAIIRFMVETGCRAGEVAVMAMPDVDLQAGTVIVRRGIGGRGRGVPFGPQTTRALDRYIRARRAHRLAAIPAPWLGDRGKLFGYDALHKSLALRARVAGVDGFHPHRLRRTATHGSVLKTAPLCRPPPDTERCR